MSITVFFDFLGFDSLVHILVAVVVTKSETRIAARVLNRACFSDTSQTIEVSRFPGFGDFAVT